MLELVSQRDYIIGAFRFRFCFTMCLYGISNILISDLDWVELQSFEVERISKICLVTNDQF